METSLEIGKIAPAFVKAQASCNGAKKASNNPHFKSKYADLTQVWAACDDALQANGLSVIQGLGEVVDNKMQIDTMLLHGGGGWIKARAAIPLPKSDPQGYGSASTYARRYTLAAMMGIVQEDDDGNAAMPRKADNVVCINDGQFAELATLSEQVGADVRAMCAFYKINSLKEMPADRFDHAKRSLQAKIKKEA